MFSLSTINLLNANQSRFEKGIFFLNKNKKLRWNSQTSSIKAFEWMIIMDKTTYCGEIRLQYEYEYEYDGEA